MHSAPAVLAKQHHCRLMPLRISLRQRRQRSGNEASPCHAELVKMVISKNQEDGLLCDSGKTFQAKTDGCTFVSASARSLAPVCFPKANANGKRGRLFKQA